MKQSIIMILAAGLIVGSAFAQTAARPNNPPMKAECTTTTTYIHGLQDNFTGGPEPTTLSPALAAFLAPLANPATYDYQKPNNHFGDSFQICGCRTCGGTLEIRVQRTNPPNGSDNDGITVGVAPFNAKIISAVIWAAGDPPVKTLTFNLDPGTLNDILCAQKTNSPWLDVYVQDDTTVDFIKLTILHP